MRLNCKILFFFCLSLWISTPHVWAQVSVRDVPKTVHYTYTVIAKRAAKQSITLDGLHIKSFDGGVFTLTDNGTLYFFADTDKGHALFANQKALAYFGKSIDGGAFVDAGAAVHGELIDTINETTGDIIYEMAYEADGHTQAVAVLNDTIVYKFPYSIHGEGDSGFTKDGKYAIPVTVSFTSPNKWLIGGTLQDAAPNGSVGERAPINGIPDTTIICSLVHTDLYADELCQKELGIKSAGIRHDDIIVEAVANFRHHCESSRNKKGQIALLLSADGMEGNLANPSDVAQVIILATPTNAPTPEEVGPQEGDVVVYRKGGHYNHVAIVIDVRPGTAVITKVRSKWNGGAIYDHDPNQTLNYGKNWTVWRRREHVGATLKMRNALNLGITHTIDLGGTQVFKTDRLPFPRNIHFGHSEPLSGPVAETFPGLPSVKRFELPPNRLSFDCRGYVFGGALQVPISETYLGFNQVQEILDDGYRRINAKDTDGVDH